MNISNQQHAKNEIKLGLKFCDVTNNAVDSNNYSHVAQDLRSHANS